jgi:hypothetical protein
MNKPRSTAADRLPIEEGLRKRMTVYAIADVCREQPARNMGFDRWRLGL